MGAHAEALSTALARLGAPPASLTMNIAAPASGADAGYREGAAPAAPVLVLELRTRSGRAVMSLILSLALMVGSYVFLARQLETLALILALGWSPLVYAALAKVLNTARIDAGAAVTVSESPVPWGTRGPFALADLEGFEVKFVGRRRRRGSYEVHARIRGGGTQTVAGSIDDPSAAKFIADALGVYLAATRTTPDQPSSRGKMS